MSNETARLLWAIKDTFDLDTHYHSKEQTAEHRLIALRTALSTLLSGYDFEEKK
jgi:hypothetical protein